MTKAVRLCVLGWLAVAMLAASEHRGVVKFGGLALPGATVTATQGDKKFTAVTDLDGAYAFRDLADGNWNIEVADAVLPDGAAGSGGGAERAGGDLGDEAAAGRGTGQDRGGGAGGTGHSLTVPDRSLTVAAQTETSTAPAPAAEPAKNGKKKSAAAAEPANPEGGFQRASVNAAGDGAKAAEAESAPQEMNAEPADGLLINGSVNNGAASPFAQSAAFGNFRRAGRSLYNGNLGITFDNSNLDARSFSITGQDTPKPAYDRFTGLFSLGGPLPFTHKMQNRPMFVLNYQWTRNRNCLDLRTG